MDGGAWWATVHGVTKSQTQLSNFTFTFINFEVQLFKVVSVILGFGHIFPKSFSDLGPVLLYWASLVAQW